MDISQKFQSGQTAGTIYTDYVYLLLKRLVMSKTKPDFLIRATEKEVLSGL